MTRNESHPLLCYVTERHALAQPSDLPSRIALTVAAGIDWIQIREKDLPVRELLALAGAAVKAVGEVPGSLARIIINDRLDVALTARAAGVHLGESSIPAAAVSGSRAMLPAEFLIGASCHSLQAARAAERDGASYLFFGPVFATPSKLPYGAPQGINRLAEVSGSVKIPVLAIGGVTAENVHECMAAGAAGIAAIRMFQEAEDLPELVARLRLAKKN